MFFTTGAVQILNGLDENVGENGRAGRNNCQEIYFASNGVCIVPRNGAKRMYVLMDVHVAPVP